MAGQTTLSRRRLLALSAAGAVALPSAATAGSTEPSPLAALIERHAAATAALDDVCARLDRAGQDVARKYPAELCRAWLSEPSSRQWPKVRKAHGIERLESERQRLDADEKRLALELLACPCRDLDEVRMKAAYVRKADILIESLMRDERHIEALLASLAG
jgi:hypothetical protein